jgi:hypothetical protein
VVIWYIFPRFGIVCQEKSGNPGWHGILFSFISQTETVLNRVTRWICTKSHKMQPNPFLTNWLINFTGDKSSQNLGYFWNFPKAAPSKLSPNRRKFAQAGRRGSGARATLSGAVSLTGKYFWHIFLMGSSHFYLKETKIWRKRNVKSDPNTFFLHPQYDSVSEPFENGVIFF